ncbi:MAG: hypothetical protein CMP93_01965 [Gammaproteobacteria bacterium]|nr:hypothetical protein [Gammaproteobacteria bacterium]|tara:strand:+ start:1421 stop:2710 length:1290 start_codon:yes stop_codon:yes gene_type:complete
MTGNITQGIKQFDQIFRPNGKIFYGWWIVLACVGIQGLAAVTWMHSYGAYTLHLQEEFGWSMSILSLAFAITRLESGLLGPIQGWLVDKYGPRLIAIIGTLIFSIGFLYFGFVNSIPSYFIAFVLIALGSSLGGFATLMVSIVSWFEKHRAKAIAWSQLGFSLGGLCVPFVVLGLETLGWRSMAFLSGGAILIIGLPLVSLIRHNPIEYGEKPDGLINSDHTGENESQAEAHRSFSWREAMKEPSFWLISVGHALSLLTVSSMLAHLIPHLVRGMNYTIIEAGYAFALMTGVQMFGLILGGILGDRYNKQVICVLCMVGHCVGLFCVTYATNVTWVIAFAIFHGLAWGIRGPLMVALRADYFGPKSFGTIMGVSSLIVMIGMTTGPIACGLLFDHFGDYQLAFTIMAICSLSGSLCFWFAKPPLDQAPS